ncbi:MAG: sigma 54-interacting transcriptional regulator, partial [Deltaproteobacteria bacterium]|nr:sigma 54-interacting transcriptional regulator [Deltaproteobacteria bacterium]
PLSIQVKLLRAIQEREIRRIGSNDTVKIDVRFISATNKDLISLIKEGRFREDLYYRLNVIEINLPPLRERKGDVLIIASYFLKRFSEELKKAIKGFSPEAIFVLENYEWPGNVRELENAIERAVVMCQSDAISIYDLPLHITKTQRLKCMNGVVEKYADAKRRVIEAFEKSYFTNLLKQTDGNISKAAKIANIDRSNLSKILKKYPDVHRKSRS